jgi:SAM-dependent methyltransferase
MNNLERVVRRGVLTLNRRAWRHHLAGPVEFWKMKRDFQMVFLRSQGLQPEHRLLDIGCGTLRGGIPIIDYLDCSHYYGIEVRPSVLAEGLKELCDAGLEAKCPTLIVGEVGAIDIPVRLDFVWAFSVLIHMTDDIVERTVAFAARQIGSGGAFYANVRTDTRSADGHWQGFPVASRPLAFYQAICARHGLVLQDLGELAALGHQSGSATQDAQRMLRITAQDTKTAQHAPPSHAKTPASSA